MEDSRATLARRQRKTGSTPEHGAAPASPPAEPTTSVVSHRWKKRDEPIAPTHEGYDPRLPFPLVLHRRARAAVRVHCERAVARISVLAAADAVALLGLCFLLRGVGVRAWFGGRIAGIVRSTVHQGLLPSAQVLAAAG